MFLCCFHPFSSFPHPPPPPPPPPPQRRCPCLPSSCRQSGTSQQCGGSLQQHQQQQQQQQHGCLRVTFTPSFSCGARAGALQQQWPCTVFEIFKKAREIASDLQLCVCQQFAGTASLIARRWNLRVWSMCEVTEGAETRNSNGCFVNAGVDNGLRC